jgi:hypothetical protein
MRTGQNNTVTGPVAFLPLFLGCCGLLLCAVYQEQRFGLFLNSFYSFDRFVQHHLDGFVGAASLAAIFGIVCGVAIRCVRGRSRIVTYGIFVSFVALLWATMGLTL